MSGIIFWWLVAFVCEKMRKKMSEEEAQHSNPNISTLLIILLTNNEQQQPVGRSRQLIIFALIVFKSYYIDSLTFVLARGAQHLRDRTRCSWIRCTNNWKKVFFSQTKYYEWLKLEVFSKQLLLTKFLVNRNRSREHFRVSLRVEFWRRKDSEDNESDSAGKMTVDGLC